MSDLKYALRSFLRTPGFTAVAIVTLALGIGANTAIFSVVNAVLLRPLPYPRPDEIVQVWTNSAAEPKSAHAAADFLELQDRNHTLTRLAGYREDAFTVAVPGTEPVRLIGALVTIDYFDVFDTPALLGRTFNRAADGRTTESLIVVSQSAWTHQLHGNPAVAGSRITINGAPHTVVGVMPATFDYPERAQAWVLSSKRVPLPPIDVKGDLLQSRGVHYFKAVGRLHAGVTVGQAQSDLSGIASDIARRFPDMNGDRGITLQPLREEIVGDVRPALLMLLGAVGLVLLIACANIASLLLARASGRRRELAIRAALGARRSRLIRQLITESLLIGAAGGVAGLLAGSWAVALLLRIAPDGIPRVHDAGLDMRIAAIGIAASLASAVLFGLVPALQASRTHDAVSLRDADRAATAGVGRARTRAVLVVAEIALTLLLLVSAGLLANSFVRLQNVDPGFRAEHVTVLTVPLPQTKYSDGPRQAAFYQSVLDRLQHHQEVESAAILFPSPIEGKNANGIFTVEGETMAATEGKYAAIASVSSDYFRTLGIPLIQGRTFTDHDRDPAPGVAIVNAELARRYLGGRDPIGQRIRFGDSGEDWKTVVGVVGTSRNLGLAEAPSPAVYIPYQVFPLPFMRIAARSTTVAPGVVASVMRSEVRAADPDLPLEEATPLETLLHESVAEPKFRALLLGAFALMAVVLAVVGVYGLISYTVTQRTREIGIRIALGAHGAQILRPMLREGLTLAVTGVGIGLFGAFATSRLLSRFLFNIGATDPLTYASVSIVLLALALLASYIPSRRVLRLDPLTALRND
jgi:putative ABC transport system permease protein